MANKLLVVTLMTVRDAIAVVACIRTNCPGAVKQLSVLIHHGPAGQEKQWYLGTRMIFKLQKLANRVFSRDVMEAMLVSLNKGMAALLMFPANPPVIEAQASVKLNNGAFMPSIALGTWMSMKGQVGEAVKIAIENGYKHIDCAHVHGNEDEIGENLTEVFNEGKIKREDLFIVSKLWCDSQAPEDVLPACQTTLKNLQLKYLDLYLIHFPIAFKKEAPFPHSVAEGTLGYSKEKVAKTWEAMEQLVKQGLCKAIGISNFTIKKITNLLETANIVPACNQVELHPYLAQPELVKFCASKGIVVTAYSPLGSPDRPFGDKSKEPILMEDPVLKNIADKHNSTIALVVLAWGIKRETPVLPKSVSENHIKENIKALDLKLDEDDMKAIENIGVRFRYLKQDWMYKPEEVPADFWDGEE